MVQGDLHRAPCAHARNQKSTRAERAVGFTTGRHGLATRDILAPTQRAGPKGPEGENVDARADDRANVPICSQGVVGRRRAPPRRVARLLYALCDRANTARRNRYRRHGVRRRGRPRGNCRTARSPYWTRGCARRTKSSRRSQPTTDWHSRHRIWQHHLRRRCHWSIPRTSGGAEHDLAREAQPG